MSTLTHSQRLELRHRLAAGARQSPRIAQALNARRRSA